MEKLQKGDKVAVISPAGKVDEQKILKATQVLKNWGLDVVVGKHAFSTYNKLAGTDNERLEDLQWALDSHEIKAIFCTRGGYGLIRIIDKVIWSKFTANPKFIIGFSDVTVLHNKVHQLGVSSIHGPMLNSYHTTPNLAMQNLHKALFSDNYQIENSLLQENEVVGGNLSIIYNLLGTKVDIETKGKVLFLEEIGEYAYHVDRMFRALKLAGKLNDLKGLALGYFTNIKDDNFGFTVKDIVLEVTKEYHYPVLFDVKAGHEDNNNPILFGLKNK